MKQGALQSNIKINPRKNVQTITIKSGVQLLEITIKCPMAQTSKSPSKEDEPIEKLEEIDKMAKENKTEQTPSKVLTVVNAYVPHIPFPQRLQKHKLDAQFAKFLEILRSYISKHHFLMT
ncbi:Uncharacterized protein Adt_06091 [Abeliophyllum distichum]|uniref:Uncharacterized protein n=1 Tax=Abeliophyllum distichum TaxID=126358 RepID=A0ABD1V5Y2_9LAMI